MDMRTLARLANLFDFLQEQAGAAYREYKKPASTVEGLLSMPMAMGELSRERTRSRKPWRRSALPTAAP